MEIQENGSTPVQRVRGAIGRGRTKVSQALGHAPEIAGQARVRAEHVAEGLPGTFRQVRTGAEGTVTNLQTVSDSRLRMLVAASIGLGAGLRLAGASRLASLAALAPASVAGFAIVSRPHRKPADPMAPRP